MKKIPTYLQKALCAAILFLAPVAYAMETIDIMIVYTPAVKAVYGDHDGVEARALALVASTNLAYQSSDLDLEVQLVRIEEVSYVESAVSLGIDLNALRSTDDGILDDVHTLRDVWGGDLVCLLRSGAVANNAGLADLLKTETGRDDVAFSVVTVESALSNLTFQHEIGHNLGASHARMDPGGIDDPNADPNGDPDALGGLFDYSNGYRFTANPSLPEYRTVMAYSPGQLINQFSNPELTHEGEKTGIAVAEADAADNVATFKVTTPLVSQYREHMPELPAVGNVTQSLALAQGGFTFLYAKDVVGVPSLTVQWYEGLSGDISSPLADETGYSVNTGPLTSTTNYWLRATNDNGSTDSSTITVSVTQIPSGIDADQEQLLRNNGLVLPWDRTSEGFIFDPIWQEFVPSVSYTDSIDVYIWKGQDPVADILVQLFAENEDVIYEQTITASEVSASFASEFNLPIRMYLNIGDTYRIEMSATAALDFNGGVTYAWAYSDNVSNPYTPGASNFSDFDYMFRTNGSNALPPTVTLDPTSRSVALEAVSYSINITSNTSWNVVESLDWLSISPESGSGNGQVTVSVDLNNSGSIRSGMVNIGGVDHQITQSLDSATIEISPTIKSLSSVSSMYSVSVTTPGNWSAVASDGWLTVFPMSGSGDATFEVTATANTSAVLREATIAVGSEVHTVRQVGTVTEGLTFDQWIQVYFTTSDIAAMVPNSKRADSDGDGLDNYGEMTLRLDPNLKGESGRLTITQDGDNAVLTFEPHNSSLTYRLFMSTNLTAWSLVDSATISTTSNSITFEVPIQDGVTYRISAVE